MQIDNNSLIDQEINECIKICKELNFLNPDGSPNFDDCLKFLIEFDKVQELNSQLSDGVSTPRNLTFYPSENNERVFSARNTAPVDNLSITTGVFSSKGDKQ